MKLLGFTSLLHRHVSIHTLLLVALVGRTGQHLAGDTKKSASHCLMPINGGAVMHACSKSQLCPARLAFILRRVFYCSMCTCLCGLVMENFHQMCQGSELRFPLLLHLQRLCFRYICLMLERLRMHVPSPAIFRRCAMNRLSQQRWPPPFTLALTEFSTSRARCSRPWSTQMRISCRASRNLRCSHDSTCCSSAVCEGST